MSDDPYVYPGTDVLCNVRGIRDGGELEEFEARLTFLRSLQLGSKPISGEYDLAHLRAFHRYLFAGLYEWAGAHYLSDVNALHPFRDGNGRAQRAFFAQLASDAGYRLDWQLVHTQDNIDASVAAMQGDEAPMRDLLDEITKPLA